MYEDRDLDAAVTGGILSAATAEQFRHFAAARTGRLPADDEATRLSAGVSDLFVAIGVALLCTALFLSLRQFGLGAGWCFVGVGWILAEYFVRQRRMLLTGMLLLGVLIAGGLCGMFAVSLSMLPGSAPPNPNWTAIELAVDRAPMHGFAVYAGIALLCWIYWKRFGVALAYAGMVLMLFNVPYFLARLLVPAMPAALEGALLLGCGLATFALAMLWDMTDVYRQTVRADVAFWLHAIAGFTIGNVIPRLAIGLPVGSHEPYERFRAAMLTLDTFQALSILAIYGIFMAVSLIVDRRALMLSGLVFAFSAFASLSGSPQDRGPMLLGTGMLAVLILAAAIWWAPLRRMLLALFPDTFRAQLPRTELPRPRARPIV